MLGFFRRRARVRQARAAEAAGDLVGAARLFGQLGERGKVGACWARIAERALSDEERIAALRTAIEHLDGGEDASARKEAEVRLARILVARADLHGVTGARERELLAEAAATLERHGETLEAGRAWERLSRPEDAARAFQTGGHVEALERVLSEDVERTTEARQVSRKYDEYRLALASGVRDRALEAIRACATLGPASGGYPELLRDLEARLPRPGRVTLSVDGESREVVSRDGGVVFGRGEADVPLRNLDVSRRHLEIRPEGDAWIVEDLGSRSGTRLDGLDLGAAVRLPVCGRLGIGPSVVVEFRLAASHVGLEIVEGLDRGRRICLLRDALPIEGTRRSLVFREGRAVLAGEGRLLLNGAKTADDVVLLVGDVVEADGHRIEVKE